MERSYANFNLGWRNWGHIYPALAVATHLRNTYNADILYLGSDDGLETQLVPAAGFRMATIKAGKLQRYVSVKTIKGIARVPVGMVQALGIVRNFHPDATFTSGGYVAVPAGLASRVNGVPLLLHQQDVPPNLSNKLIGPLANRISIAFADSQKYFPADKTLLLGNPIRQEILDIRQVSPQQARSQLGLAPELPLILVTGGSQGARHLNQVVARALPELLKTHQVLQISGQKLFAETQSLAESTIDGLDSELRQRYRLVPYLSDEMPLALQAAELVICRAGAATLSELAVLEKPSILVPLPPAIGSSPQEVNAETFSQAQAAEVIRNDALKPELLISRVQHITNSASLLDMAQALKGFARPSATSDIAEAVVQMAQGTTTGAKAPEHKGINA
ncbi:undecaprenyldiphospho-muramoylpentapeptide beta-N-acetylglucosaminyltransferase [Dictyobacter kobayashii]|uniref:UDP-N-acetylglucosamine--N-acetylmuramyl-(pentapeptide) pyrophosphoryl-undecaprenol N-acetylglucosamine transferase n=1 Tax=Dictyobacter kobayashii TaxID=2014872 RepID=A0A402AG88_9CHLR|nr:undecaprenyldiphospho-muramoylpentapeptide beta-N-acetylglucosaminyltransferase [Dictyobacter kobayashii]GCE18106.1 undecaprenyldiphospho-muramoylpentapeptide beta-N- acetylglucosaminyltransferase [Dictyobacter kobayashii]